MMRRVHWHIASDRALAVAVSCTYRQRTTCRSGCAAERVARTVANTAARAIASDSSSTLAEWRRRCVAAIHSPSRCSSRRISSSNDHSEKVKLVHDDYWAKQVASGALVNDDAQQRVARQLQRLQIVLSSQYSSNQPVLQSYSDYLYRRHLYDQKVAHNSDSAKSKTLRQTKSAASTDASTATTLRSNDDMNQTREHQRDALGLPPLLPPTNAVPRGLYLYGTVGTGKSMLMDAFYKYTRNCSKKRYHFYEFMNDIHQRLHRLRLESSELRLPTERRNELGVVDDNDDNDSRTSFVSTLNPVVQVALQMASECTLLCLDEFQVVDIADAVILSQLLSTLLACGTVVVTTSNRSPYALYDDPTLGGRQNQDNDNDTHLSPFIKVLKTHCIVHEIKTTIDYRHVVAAAAASAVTKTPMSSQPQPKELRHGIGTIGSSDTTSTSTSTSGMYLVAPPAKAASSIVNDNPRQQSTDQSPSTSTIDLLKIVNDALGAATMERSSLQSHVSIETIQLDAGFGRVISVQAMTVPTMRESSSLPIKVAYCTFDELCSSRHSHCYYGPSDYRALARHFDVVILRDIPVLSNGNMADVVDSSLLSSDAPMMRDHNEARRFIALIDELYEAQTLVACSAAIPLSELFRVVHSPHDNIAAEASDGRASSTGSSSLLIESVKELPFAFRRAASRLVELTSFQKWNQLRTSLESTPIDNALFLRRVF